MARPSNSADALFLRTPAFRYLLAGALTLASCGLAAQEAPPAAAPQAEILHLDVSVNGRPRHLIAKFRRDAEGNFSSPRSELAELGIRAPGSGAPQEEIAFDAIDGLTYDYDAPAQKMNITLAPEAMAERVYGAASETQ
jgi:outer membrane usher protein